MFKTLPSPYHNYVYDANSTQLGKVCKNRVRLIKPKSKSSYDLNLNNKHHVFKNTELAAMVGESPNNVNEINTDAFFKLETPYNHYIYNPLKDVLFNTKSQRVIKSARDCGYTLSNQGVPSYFPYKLLKKLLTTEIVDMSLQKEFEDKIFELTGELSGYAYNPAKKSLYKFSNGKLNGLVMNRASGYCVYLNRKTRYFSIAKLETMLSNIEAKETTPPKDNKAFILCGSFSNYAYNPTTKQLYRIKDKDNALLYPLKSKKGAGYMMIENTFTGKGCPKYYNNASIESKMTNKCIVLHDSVYITPKKSVIVDAKNVVTVTPNVLEYNIAVNPTETIVENNNVGINDRYFRLPALLSSYVYDKSKNTLNSIINDKLYPIAYKNGSKSSWSIMLKGYQRTLTLEMVFGLINAGKTTPYTPIIDIPNEETKEEPKEEKSKGVWILINKGNMQVETVQYSSESEASDAALLKTETHGNLYQIFQLVAETNKGKSYISKV